jgi:drug/metabolite transporter (DMT)-like permease
LHHIAHKYNDHKALAFYQILCTAPLPLLFSWQLGFPHVQALLYPSVIIGILFCAIFATSLALFLQTKYQPFTTAPKAAIIYSLEPVFASLFGFLINGEAITSPVIIGGALILLSLTLPPLLLRVKIYAS